MIEYDEPRTPPHSREAEQAVLGAVLLDQNILDDLAGIIEPGYFYQPDHQTIFQTMQEMSGQPIDVVTLSDLNNAISLDYLVELAGSTPTTFNALRYAAIVAERKKERDLITAGQLFIELCHDRSIPHQERIERSQVAFTALSSERKADTQVCMKTSAVAVLANLDARLNGHEDGKQLKTGLNDIDKRIMGFRAGDLVLIGARPSMGKTTYMTHIAKHVAKNYGKVMIFSLEMTHESLTQRMIASDGPLHMGMMRDPSTANRDENFWPKLTAATNRVISLPIEIDDQGGLSVGELRARARREHRKSPISMIMVDYLGKLNDGGRTRDNRNQEISNISADLKNLAKELECPVIALSQLNRSLESRTEKRPNNSDLRDSGSLEQDADIIQFLYRDEIYNPATDYGGVLEIITSKFREGEIGTDRVLFEGQFNRIRDLDADKYREQQTAHNNSKPAPYIY
jgi:replicative DNA helicase